MNRKETNMSDDNVENEVESQASEKNSETQTYKAKMVPESTLISIRKGYTDEIKKLKESINSEVQKNIDLQSNLDSLTETKTKFEQLQSEHQTLSEKLYIGELHRHSLLSERVDSLRGSVASRAGIKPEVLKEKTYDQLVALNESLDIIGKPKSSDFASKASQTDKATMSKDEVLGSMLDEAKERSRGGKS